MDTTKIYFATEEERDEFNAAEAAIRGCDGVWTVYWYGHGEDEDGFYVEYPDEDPPQTDI